MLLGYLILVMVSWAYIYIKRFIINQCNSLIRLFYKKEIINEIMLYKDMFYKKKKGKLKYRVQE